MKEVPDTGGTHTGGARGGTPVSGSDGVRFTPAAPERRIRLIGGTWHT